MEKMLEIIDGNLADISDILCTNYVCSLRQYEKNQTEENLRRLEKYVKDVRTTIAYCIAKYNIDINNIK